MTTVNLEVSSIPVLRKVIIICFVKGLIFNFITGGGGDATI